MGQEYSTLHSMRSQWKKIFNAHRLAHSGMVERLASETRWREKDMVEVDHSIPTLLTSVMDNVIRQLTRD
jgi:hypothetical protein